MTACADNLSGALDDVYQSSAGWAYKSDVVYYTDLQCTG